MLTVDQLISGTHLMSVTEDLQVIWFEVEDHLKHVITDGLVVETNIDSAGQSKPRHLPSSSSSSSSLLHIVSICINVSVSCLTYKAGCVVASSCRLSCLRQSAAYEKRIEC